MRHVIYAIIAIAIVATLATLNLAVSQGTMVCRPGGNCLTTTAAIYNSCVDLALRRGVLLTKDDRWVLDRFVYQCVAGRIPK
jgi:hypothetical protein